MAGCENNTNCPLVAHALRGSDAARFMCRLLVIVMQSGLIRFSGLTPRCVFEPLDLNTSKTSPNCRSEIKEIGLNMRYNVNDVLIATFP